MLNVLGFIGFCLLFLILCFAGSLAGTYLGALLVYRSIGEANALIVNIWRDIYGWIRGRSKKFSDETSQQMVDYCKNDIEATRRMYEEMPQQRWDEDGRPIRYEFSIPPSLRGGRT